MMTVERSGSCAMSADHKTPSDIARRLAKRAREQAEDNARPGSWRRETFNLPRGEARDKAREWFNKFPKAAYMTEIESWRELADDRIEFTMRRLPTAD
jgi:hypothetical protein